MVDPLLTSPLITPSKMDHNSSLQLLLLHLPLQHHLHLVLDFWTCQTYLLCP